MPDTRAMSRTEATPESGRPYGEALGRPLPLRFYARDSREVARALIGCRLVHDLPDGDRLVVRLTEVEAYLGDGSDPASHAHPGPTERNRTMFGPPARLYAYRSYGIHTCVNVVCETKGRAAAVLLRAGEPRLGLPRMAALRGLGRDARPEQLTVGPGRLAQALGLDLDDDGACLRTGALRLYGPASGFADRRIETGPRVGITRAADLPYRYFEAAPETDARRGRSRWVTPFRPGKRRAPPTR